MLAREMFLVMGGGSGSIPRAYQGAVELGFLSVASRSGRTDRWVM